MAHAASAITDPELRRKLTPDYMMGCKRVLVANDYYPALTRANVELVTDGIAEVRSAPASWTPTGVEHEVDAIIFGTGFHVTDAFDYLEHDRRGRAGPGQGMADHGHPDPSRDHRGRLPEPVLPARPEHRRLATTRSCS